MVPSYVVTTSTAPGDRALKVIVPRRRFLRTSALQEGPDGTMCCHRLSRTCASVGRDSVALFMAVPPGAICGLLGRDWEIKIHSWVSPKHDATFKNKEQVTELARRLYRKRILNQIIPDNASPNIPKNSIPLLKK